MKRALRRSKKIWVRNRSTISWKSYQQVRRFYQIKITEKKIKTISKKIEQCGSDTKKLFKLLNHLTGCKPEIPLPARTNDKELADGFTDFFIQKIIRMQNELDNYPIYQPSNSNAPRFNNFEEIDQDQAKKIIFNTKSKSCKLDPVPTTLLKTSYLESYLQ